MENKDPSKRSQLPKHRSSRLSVHNHRSSKSNSSFCTSQDADEGWLWKPYSVQTGSASEWGCLLCRVPSFVPLQPPGAAFPPLVPQLPAVLLRWWACPSPERMTELPTRRIPGSQEGDWAAHLALYEEGFISQMPTFKSRTSSHWGQ